MSLLKKQIQQLYKSAIHFNEPAEAFSSKILEVIGEDESRLPRTKRQNRARWKYLTMVSDELNDRGETFNMPGLEIPLKYNKDVLYHCFWQEVKRTLFPDKKKTLNTKEFCMVVDHVMDLFSMAFDIHIAFPNMKDFIREIEEKRKSREE